MVCTSSARAAVQSLVKSLSIELAPKIRVNSVLLGLIESGQWERRFEARTDLAQSRSNWFAELAKSKEIPLQRLGEPEEPARLIVFLGFSGGELCYRRERRCVGWLESAHLTALTSGP